MSKPKDMTWKDKTAFTPGTPAQVFSLEQTNQLIQDYGFQGINAHELAFKLNDHVLDFEVCVTRNIQKYRPTREDQKKLLSHLDTQIKHMIDGIKILRNYGHDTIKMLEYGIDDDIYSILTRLNGDMDALGRRILKAIHILKPGYIDNQISSIKELLDSEICYEPDKPMLRKSLEQFEQIKLQAKISPKSKGNTSTKPFHIMINGLKNIYEQYTGKIAKDNIKHSSYAARTAKEEYKGEFLDFVLDVVAILEKTQEQVDVGKIPGCKDNRRNPIGKLLYRLLI